MKIKIDISTPYLQWKKEKDVNKKHILLVLKRILSIYPNFNSIDSIELSILLTNNIEITKLNLMHRDKEEDTNILSFPDSEELLYKKNILNGDIYLGDLALSYNKIIEESKERNISFYNHFTHLIIHGILHLLGYDHKEEIEAQEMESLEVQLLKTFNIPTPY
jgi:probable rRNA maturation factor